MLQGLDKTLGDGWEGIFGKNSTQTIMAVLCYTEGDHNNHRLSGSSSPVLTATARSYGKGHISTLYKIKTPEQILIKLG